ncbi:hypothetical protein [Arthrobacter gyeryongensis]
MQLSALTKGRIEQLLDGGGLPPTWDEARTLYKTLHRIATEESGVEAQTLPAIDDEKLRTIVETTHVLPPYKRMAASHFASKILQWGQEHAIQYVQRQLEDRELWLKDNGYFRYNSTEIKKTKEELQKHEKQPDLVIQGALAITHNDPTPPLYYQDVFDHKMVNELREYQEQKIMRLDGHSISVKIDYLETGIRLTYSISGNDYVKGFVAIEVSSLGSVAVYFRWIPIRDDEQFRTALRVGWGLVGAAQLCLHTHAIFGASGDANAYFMLPKYASGNIQSLPFSKPGLYSYPSTWNVVITHFGDIIERLTGAKDIEEYLNNARTELWSAG